MLQTVVRPNERIPRYLTKGTPMGWRPAVWLAIRPSGQLHELSNQPQKALRGIVCSCPLSLFGHAGSRSWCPSYCFGFSVSQRGRGGRTIDMPRDHSQHHGIG